jgi:hypothetical protein
VSEVVSEEELKVAEEEVAEEEGTVPYARTLRSSSPTALPLSSPTHPSSITAGDGDDDDGSDSDNDHGDDVDGKDIRGSGGVGGDKMSKRR